MVINIDNLSNWNDNYMLFNQYMNLQEEYEYFYEQKTFYHSEKEEVERKIEVELFWE